MTMSTCRGPDRTIEQLIAGLESLVDGCRSEAILLARGKAAIEPLARYLLSGAPRTIALPRCRAARILGGLGAYSTLIRYLRDLHLPDDPGVLFAEDAVRSEVAKELAQWKTEESFGALLEATKIRATCGLVSALGEFNHSESIPCLFGLLEDDLCREVAMETLRKMPEASHHYGIMLLRGQTGISIRGPASLRRLRATLHLVADLSPTPSDWDELKPLLMNNDPEVVITAGSVGVKVGATVERSEIFQALLRVSDSVNWSQENAIEALLDTDGNLASTVATIFASQQLANRKSPNWLVPSWRILRHALGDSLMVMMSDRTVSHEKQRTI